MSPLPPPAPAAPPHVDTTTAHGTAASPLLERSHEGGTSDPSTIAAGLVSAIDAVVAGQHDVAEIAVATLLAGGHLLIEDIPGVGKTLLAQVLARAVGGSFGRIQGTPDLLPGDVTGALLPTVDGRSLAFRPGPIFANIVVFDELNRATPRTQSALLEAAEESTVTVDGSSHALPDPFMLVATQNPIDVAGTYGLGEGSLDRFAAVVTPGRAPAELELDVVTGRRGRTLLQAIDAVVDLGDLVAARAAVAQVHVTDAVGAYVVDLLSATRAHPAVRLGASTRAGVSLVSLARARAAMAGRTYVVPDDVRALAVTALGHRVIVADSDGSTGPGRHVVDECLRVVSPPTA